MKRLTAEGWSWWEERVQRSRRIFVGVMQKSHLDYRAELLYNALKHHLTIHLHINVIA